MVRHCPRCVRDLLGEPAICWTCGTRTLPGMVAPAGRPWTRRTIAGLLAVAALVATVLAGRAVGHSLTASLAAGTPPLPTVASPAPPTSTAPADTPLVDPTNVSTPRALTPTQPPTPTTGVASDVTPATEPGTGSPDGDPDLDALNRYAARLMTELAAGAAPELPAAHLDPAGDISAALRVYSARRATQAQLCAATGHPDDACLTTGRAADAAIVAAGLQAAHDRLAAHLLGQ